MVTVLVWVLSLAVLPVLAVCAYLGLLVLLSWPCPVPAPSERRRFQIIVPAHDEELGIAQTVQSLQRLDYPAQKLTICVVADNCSDQTAARAREAGAQVLERHDAEHRGKGYALLHAFERVPDDVDGVVVIDADTLVSENLLSAFAARLDAGASAIQADYAVRNVHQSWRTRLIAVAFGCFHIVRGRARERLSLSAGLRGNGMCFAREVLARVPHDAFSIVEDVEYGIRLGEAGLRVHYADEAHVYGEMVSGAASAASQRKRWEGGRTALARKHAGRLLKKGLAARSAVLFDLGLDLLIPPLSRVAVGAAVGSAVALVCGLVWGGIWWIPAAIWGFCPAVIALYVLRGWSVSRTGLRGLRDLTLAPVYIAWKLTLGGSTERRPDAPWVRTTREAETPPAESIAGKR